MKLNNQVSLTSSPAYQSLVNRWKELSALESAMMVLIWDQRTYLPEQAAEARGAQLAVLTRMHHDLATREDLGGWLETLQPAAKELPEDSDERHFVREAHKEFDRHQRIPADLASRLAENEANSYAQWKKARAQEDFGVAQGALEKTLDLSREYAECLRKPEHQSLMDPLIDLSDEGFSETQLRPLFASLREKLIPLAASIRPSDNSCLLQKFPEADQRAFGETVLRQLGFDFKKGRQDKTEHPFMIRFAHSDVRITTRYNENDVGDGLFSTIHEAGHALYELGIDERFDSTPLGRGSSDGIHESQSRLWENLVGRGRPFWDFFYPRLQMAFPDQLKNVPLDQFYLAINHVAESLIRTDADEVTYNLHVMIRFDLESDLLAGRLSVQDLPDAWNARYRSDLGVVADRPSNGVLQDVHWFAGRIGGVFQGYTIGNILSAQLFAAAQRAIPTLDEQFRNGDFASLRNWLRTNLHQYGRKYSGPVLIQNATGKPLSTEDYFDYLDSKFGTADFR